ncbi:MAG: hypothetical protein MUF15_03735 [Acidobacteria bacterium]|jgi:hypothetical protein|nr:hypothetical protein [Acidobacteriota bacterium]
MLNANNQTRTEKKEEKKRRREEKRNRQIRNSKSEIAVFQTNPNDQKINDQNKKQKLGPGADL